MSTRISGAAGSTIKTTKTIPVTTAVPAVTTVTMAVPAAGRAGRAAVPAPAAAIPAAATENRIRGGSSGIGGTRAPVLPAIRVPAAAVRAVPATAAAAQVPAVPVTAEAARVPPVTDTAAPVPTGAARDHPTPPIRGIPGNALGAYLNGGTLTVLSNAQDAVGDTMNAGEIVIHGNIGDAAGYAMRGGSIYVKGNAGYRAGIHMKAYKDKVPVIVIGGYTGSFLGEYQAGGLIIVLGLDKGSRPIVSNFPCTGMHGGKMILRSECGDIRFPNQVTARAASSEDLAEIRKYVDEYCRLFGIDPVKLMDSPFTVVTPDSANPYKQLYVAN